MTNTLVKITGWPATILHGDPSVFDRWRWIRRQLLHGSVRTLDAGCGSGAFTMYAARCGNEAVGISFDDRNNLIATERSRLLGLTNIRFITADLRKLDEISENLGKFDQIICTEVIEHILNDRKLLADLSSLLKSGGRLILTTPFKHGRPIHGDRISDTEDGGHVRAGYTHEEIRDMFAQAGLEVAGEACMCGVITQSLMEVMRRLEPIGRTFAWAATFPLRIFQAVDVPVTRAARYPFYIIGVVGIKRHV